MSCNPLNFNQTSIVTGSISFSETSKSKTNHCGKFECSSNFKHLNKSCNDSVLNRTNSKWRTKNHCKNSLTERLVLKQAWYKLLEVLSIMFWTVNYRFICKEGFGSLWQGAYTHLTLSRYLSLVISNVQSCELVYPL